MISGIVQHRNELSELGLISWQKTQRNAECTRNDIGIPFTKSKWARFPVKMCSKKIKWMAVL